MEIGIGAFALLLRLICVQPPSDTGFRKKCPPLLELAALFLRLRPAGDPNHHI